MFVTARDSEEDVVHILSLGADDYLAKPLRRAETLARVAALTRRGRPRETPDGNLLFPPFRFRVDSRVIERDGVPQETTPKDFELALYMFRNAGKLLSRAHILESGGARPPPWTRARSTPTSRASAASSSSTGEPTRLAPDLGVFPGLSAREGRRVNLEGHAPLPASAGKIRIRAAAAAADRWQGLVRAVEYTGLENRQRGNPFVGSNPHPIRHQWGPNY